MRARGYRGRILPQSRETLVNEPGVFAVAQPSGCWVWQRSVHRNGYGQTSIGGRRALAHRVFYEHYRGLIPDGLDLDHLCRNRRCVNPDHLEPVTTRENLIRGVGFAAANASKTHCVNGHEFTPCNTYWRKPDSPTAQPTRRCRACSREWIANRRSRKPEKA